MNQPSKTTPRFALLALLLFGSGFAALVYEILWTRYLALTIGANMLAASIVAATFMGGLALGSFAFGRVADRSKNPLRLYALLEVGIGAFALLFPLALDLVEQIHIALARAFPDSLVVAFVSRFLLSVSLLLIPTACMGGTLPILSRLFGTLRLGQAVGRLYAINTAGAVAGCMLAAFFLVPTLGMTGSGLVAVGLNFGVAALAGWFSRGLVAPVLEENATEKTKKRSKDAVSPRLIFCCVAVTGALSLGFEMLWTRVFLLYLGSTTYAFATILGVYLLGLTLGAALYARFAHRSKDLPRLFRRLLMGFGFAVLLPLPFYDRLAYLFQASHVFADQRWYLLSLGSFGIVSLIVLLPAALSGALFPAAVSLLAPGSDQVGRGVGRLLFWNTLGAVSGGLLVSLAAIPLLGILGSFRFLIAGMLVLAGVFVGITRREERHRLVLPGLVAIAAVLFPISWDLRMMNSGVYYYSQKIEKAGGLEKGLSRLPKVAELIEGLEVTVAFYRAEKGERYFKINGKTDGSSVRDLRNQIMVGQLPMLFHPEAERALVVGLGTGVTLAQVAAYPGVQVDCAEISPAVVKISEHFAPENGRVLEKENVTLVVNDARNLLQTTTRRYDVIVSQPSNPWQAGNANLFTREYYRLARAALEEGGIFTQWLPIYDMDLESLRTAIHTFLETFPDMITFGVGVDLIMIGRTNLRPEGSVGVLPAAYPAGAEVLARLAPEPRVLMERYYYGDQTLLEPFSRGAPLNSDDRPRLEFHRQMGQDWREANFAALVKARNEHGTVDIPFVYEKAAPER